MSKEQQLVNIIRSLCYGVTEASESQIRKEISYAVSSVRELDFEIDSPLDGDDIDDEDEL